MSVPHTTSLRTGLLPGDRKDGSREGDAASQSAGSSGPTPPSAVGDAALSAAAAVRSCVRPRDRPLTAGLLLFQTPPNSDAGPAAAAGLAAAS